MSAKQQIPIRDPPERLLGLQHPPVLSDALHDSTTADVEGPLFLTSLASRSGLARVFGGDPMSWYRMSAGWPVQRCENHRPHGNVTRALLADEHHQRLDGQKSTSPRPSATGAACEQNGRGDRERQVEVTYQVSKTRPAMSPPNTLPRPSAPMSVRGRSDLEDAVYEGRHPAVLLTRLAQDRDRAKHLKEVFAEVSGGFEIPSRARTPEFCTRLLAPPVNGRTPHKDRPGEDLDLCGKRDRWSITYDREAATSEQHT